MNQRVYYLFYTVLIAVFCLVNNRVEAQEGDFTVRIKQPVNAVLQACPGASIIFMAEGLNADGSSFDPQQAVFTWDFGYNGQSLTGPTVTYAFAEGGHYVVRLYVTGSDNQSAQNVPELDVYVAMPPYFSGTRSDRTSICSGSEITLTGFISAVPWTGDDSTFVNVFEPDDFAWSGSGIESDHRGIAMAKPPLDEGHQNYIFRVQDDFGCFHDTTLLLYGLYADYDMDPKTGEAPLEVTFTVDSVSNGGSEDAVTYSWSFYEVTDTSNLITSDEETFSFERPGEYYNWMIAKYQSCTYEYTHPEYIRVDSSLLEIPNVFTPNEDGANDFFQVKSRSLMHFSGKIFNRWGRLVYEWTDWTTAEAGWNGRYQNTGQPVPAGTYYYVIIAVGYDDVEYRGKEYKGFLTLLR